MVFILSLFDGIFVFEIIGYEVAEDLGSGIFVNSFFPGKMHTFR